MHLYHVGKAEDAEQVGLVDNQPGEEQQQNGRRLHPVPQPLVNVVHIDLTDLFRARFGRPAGPPPRRQEAQPAMRRHAQRHANDHQRAQDVDDARSVVAQHVQPGGGCAGGEVQRAPLVGRRFARPTDLAGAIERRRHAARCAAG